MGVREAIIEAFAMTPYPGDDNIVVPNLDYESETKYFRGRTWRGHHPAELRRQAAALSTFTPEAFRFFLPAFMLVELDDPVTADIIAASIALSFTHSSSREDRTRLFTNQELIAISAFFNECALRYTTVDKKFEVAADEVKRLLDRD